MNRSNTRRSVEGCSACCGLLHRFCLSSDTMMQCPLMGTNLTIGNMPYFHQPRKLTGITYILLYTYIYMYVYIYIYVCYTSNHSPINPLLPPPLILITPRPRIRPPPTISIQHPSLLPRTPQAIHPALATSHQWIQPSLPFLGHLLPSLSVLHTLDARRSSLQTSLPFPSNAISMFDLYGCHTILLTRWLEIVRTSLVALLHPPSSYKVLITHLLHATRNQLLTSALLSAAGHLIIGCRVCSISAVVP